MHYSDAKIPDFRAFLQILYNEFLNLFMDCIGCLFTRQRLNKIGDFPYFAFGCNCLFYPLEKPPFPVWINYIRQKAKTGGC